MMAIALGGCTLVEQVRAPVADPIMTQEPPVATPSLTPFIQLTEYPQVNWPEQPVIIASGDATIPLIVWLPNGELLFGYQQGVSSGVYWLSPQGRAVYLDFAAEGAPVSGTSMGYAALIEQVLPNSLQVRLAAPGGAVRTTYKLRIDNDFQEFPARPALEVQDESSLRQATVYAGQALEYFACVAAQGATGEVRLTFDWACSSQAARLSKGVNLAQWPVVLEPLTSSLALLCPGSPKDSAAIPFGQCISEMVDWAASLMTRAMQAQRLAEQNARSTAAVLALTPATEAVEYLPGVGGTLAPTSTLGAPERLNAARDAATATPSPVPTGAGLCGWLQALPGIWDQDGEPVKGDIVEIEFFIDGRYRATLFGWPENLRGNAVCLGDGTLKLTFRQGTILAQVLLAEDRLNLDLITAIGFPASLQQEGWRYSRRLE